ncbi:SUKH-4 family immunity protein [Kitasatospora sp. P5_F3]
MTAGRLDEWLADVRGLLLSDRQALAEAVAAAGGPVADQAARRRCGAVAEAVRLYREDLRCGVAEWASRLRFAAQAWGDSELVAGLDELALPLPWRADWARWRPLGLFDTREFAPGWTGPVQVVGWRSTPDGAGGEVCLHSAHDQRCRWYSLPDGEQIGEAVDELPEVAGVPEYPSADPGFAVEVLEESFDLLKVRIRSTSSSEESVFPLCSTYPGALAHPLPGGRLLLAGHSGAAVISFGAPAERVTGARPENWATPSGLTPREAWWGQGELRADDIVPYYQGGVAYADPGRLGPLAGRADVVHVLCTLGLPGFPVFWQETFGCLERLATLEQHLTEQGESAEEYHAGFTVIALSADGETALCVDHANGQVHQAEGGSPELVNTSLLAFAACQALTSWALSVSTARQPEERYEFLAFVREALTRIDPEAAADQGTDWWWFLALEDDFTLVA